MQELDIMKISIALAIFIYASHSDWKTRRVKDVVWIALGTISLILLMIELIIRTRNDVYLLLNLSLLFPTGFIFYDIFLDPKRMQRRALTILRVALYILSFFLVSFYIISHIGTAVGSGYGKEINYFQLNPVALPLIMILAMIILFEIFYMFDVIKGGADAKAAICLAILFPWYPQLADSLPLITPDVESVLAFFPFALSVLFVAALLSLFIPLYFLFKNISAGNKISVKSLIGFSLPIHEVEKQFVWLIEWVEDGKLKFNARKPRSSETLKADLAALQALGLKEVWVTFKIPFIIPMTIAVVFVSIIGNPLFALY